MRKLSFILLSIVFLCRGLTAQTDCPQISMSGPSGVPNPGDSITFTAQVDTGGKELKIEYVWSISAGEITSGQGTDTITVKAPNGSLTTTVEIKGLPEGCSSTFSEAVQWCGRLPQPELIETFRGAITAKDKARIEKLRSVMWNDPNAQYRFFVAGKDNAQIRANVQTIIKYLRFPEDVRVTFVQIAPGSEVTGFWRIPVGADDPKVSEDGMTVNPGK